MNELFVFDTNSLVSGLLIEGSTTARAIDRAIKLGNLVFSNETLDEFIEVLFRKKFDKYFLNNEERWDAIRRISDVGFFFSPLEIITDCRDPKDNKFLEVAFAAKASCIVTGDKDLLILNPFRRIRILTANNFLDNF
ncbi:MAG: putative toxin-antitoxin system toxin component, PIN family [Ginsengibacter sp.]|jgi:putative PIN family toxin of toxin-antitoxin system